MGTTSESHSAPAKDADDERQNISCNLGMLRFWLCTIAIGKTLRIEAMKII